MRVADGSMAVEDHEGSVSKESEDGRKGWRRAVANELGGSWNEERWLVEGNKSQIRTVLQVLALAVDTERRSCQITGAADELGFADSKADLA